ncbi:hypothetical protein ASPFODRAFT_174569 [Aspergillus luchuensis CBS 106.47]|uniref:Uncharacterized protein n=1 Tax=Aspergillus luchuensis (strain CBS 106.47) TaxID=1137211 RepID=A0A1M3T0Z1_ASPLC|nr:hypothetical protein ASPFODRAFT_174569 [Aspergillus luchuensis CBS 106.47]
MRPTHQARIETEEKALEAYRQERYQGSARVRLDCLTFENGFGRLMDDGRNALRMEQILEIQGCLRINREYHVPVLVQATDWGSHIRLLPCDTEPFPELIVPLNMSLRALGHENVIAAARKRLYGENRWWVVDVYVEDPNEQPQRQTLHSHLVRSLREHFPNQRRPPDGLIYERIRFYQGKLGHPPDENAEAVWWAILRHDPKSKKHVYLRAFLQHPSFPPAFDALLLIPGLWAKMQLGVLHTMVSLRCDEPILSYLETIRTVWMDLRRGLHELWRFSFQYGLDMTEVARRQPRKRKKACSSYFVPNCSTSVDDRMALWRHFFWLADQQGFQIPAIAEFAAGQASLPNPQSPEGLGSTEEDEAVNRRCGIPYADTVDADRFALEGGRLWQPWESPQVTAVFFRRSQFQTFFRYLWDGSGINQATNAEDESAASEEAAAVDPEIPDCEIEHPIPSPSLSQLPERSNSIDWFMEMWDCGLGGMAMPAGDLDVVVTIPNHEPRRLALPNDESLINELFHGLKMRKFSLHSTDHRNVTEEENLHVWHLRNPGQNVLANLTEENVQDYTTSDFNRLKRRRKGLSEAVSDIAAWVDEQIFRLSTHVLTCSLTAQEEY